MTPASENPQPITGVKDVEEIVLLIEPGGSEILSEFAYVEEIGGRWGFRYGTVEVAGTRATWAECPIGGSNVEIFVNESAKVGGRFFMRMGAFGVARDDVRLGDILLPVEAVSACGVTQNYVRGQLSFLCSRRLLSTIKDELLFEGVSFHEGKILTVDSFYGANSVEDGGIRPVTFSEFETDLYHFVQGTLRDFHGIDMETAALYCVCECLGLDAVALLCGSDRVPWRAVREEEFDFQGAQRRLFEVALRILPSLSGGMSNGPVGEEVWMDI